LTALDRFISALEARGQRVRKSGDGYVSRCPAHDDKEPSLSLKQGDKGVVVKCHTGCAIEAILVPLGLEARDLFDEELAPPIGGDFESRIEATYDYVDEDGKLLFQALRLRDPKSFRQRTPDGKWSIKDIRRVPYRLPQLLAAAAEHKAVWVAEGEKDVEALERLGFVATCNPMGAGKWRDEYVEYFKGVPWALVTPHCDDPASKAGDVGRKHADDVARSLKAAGIAVKVIDLAPDRIDGYDVSDFIAEHGDEARDLLQEYARTTPAWPISKLAPLPIVSVKDFLAGIPIYDTSKDYLGPFLHGGHRVHIAGPIGHGKTSFLMEAVSAAVRGTEFLGWRGKGDIRALYIDLEMPAELLGQAFHDARLDQCNGHVSLLHLPDGLEVDTNPKHRELIERAVDGFDIVVVDPWYKLLANELEYASGRQVIALFDGIRTRHPKLCVAIGFHAQEPQMPNMPVTLGNVSGFKFFQRPADIVLTFQRTKGDQSRIRWEKNRSARLDVKKGEQWTLEWERGAGFKRTEQKSAADEVFDLLTDEWQTTYEIADAWGKSRNHTTEQLGRLAHKGVAESRGGDQGGRGAVKVWRRVQEGQEVLAV
jgi:hypothetical protein